MLYTPRKFIVRLAVLFALTSATFHMTTNGVLPDHFYRTHQEAVICVANEIIKNLPVKWKNLYDKNAHIRLLYNVHLNMWQQNRSPVELNDFVEEQWRSLAWEESIDPNLGDLTQEEQLFANIFFGYHEEFDDPTRDRKHTAFSYNTSAPNNSFASCQSTDLPWVETSPDLHALKKDTGKKLYFALKDEKKRRKMNLSRIRNGLRTPLNPQYHFRVTADRKGKSCILREINEQLRDTEFDIVLSDSENTTDGTEFE